MRKVVTLIAAAGVLAWAILLPRAHVQKQPDVLVIVIDDLGFWNGHYGDPTNPATPALDAFAAQGITFTRCYGSPTCQPARMTINTGHVWVTDAGPAISGSPHTPKLGEKFLPERMNAAGYSSALFGKWHLGVSQIEGWTPEKAPRSQGYSFWYTGLRANINAWYGEDEPQEPIDYDYWWRVEAETGELVTSFQPDEMEARFLQLYPLAASPKFTMVCTSAPHAPFDPFPGCSPFGFPAYWYECMTEYVDHSIGDILAAVDLETTLVIVCGDNGTPPQVGGNKAKATCYERGVRVPLIIAGAGVTAPGSWTDELVTLEDIYATCIAAGGGTVIPGLHTITSRDLGPLLRGESWKPREHIVVGDNWKNVDPTATRCLVSNDGWKLIQKDTNGDEVPEAEELYDLLADPNELVNVIAANAARADDMRVSLEAESIP